MCAFLVLTSFVTSCSSVREDRVFSENYQELACNGNPICELSENIIVLRKVREVSAGIARNYTGTLQPGCKPIGENYSCATDEIVVRKDKVSVTRITTLVSRIMDGYDSSRSIIDLGNCKVMMTIPSDDLSYLSINKVYDFSKVIKDDTLISNRTGGLLEDYSEAKLFCQNECNYEVLSDVSSNSIEILLSKDRTSGQLSTAQLQKRKTSISELLEECQSLVATN